MDRKEVEEVLSKNLLHVFLEYPYLKVKSYWKIDLPTI